MKTPYSGVQQECQAMLGFDGGCPYARGFVELLEGGLL